MATILINFTIINPFIYLKFLFVFNNFVLTKFCPYDIDWWQMFSVLTSIRKVKWSGGEAGYWDFQKSKITVLILSAINQKWQCILKILYLRCHNSQTFNLQTSLGQEFSSVNQRCLPFGESNMRAGLVICYPAKKNLSVN